MKAINSRTTQTVDEDKSTEYRRKDEARANEAFTTFNTFIHNIHKPMRVIDYVDY